MFMYSFQDKLACDDTMLSPVSFVAGKWMYEVMVNSSGVMQFGWCTQKCAFTNEVSSVLYLFVTCKRMCW